MYRIQVKAFNGHKIKNLKHLIELVDANKEEFLRYDLADESLIVLEAKEAKKAHQEILREYKIPSDRSLNYRRS